MEQTSYLTAEEVQAAQTLHQRAHYVDAVMREVYAATTWDARIAEIERALWAALDSHEAQLRAALQEADTLMGHDDAETEWRNKWAGLWPTAGLGLAPKREGR